MRVIGRTVASAVLVLVVGLAGLTIDVGCIEGIVFTLTFVPQKAISLAELSSLPQLQVSTTDGQSLAASKSRRTQVQGRAGVS